MIRRPKIRRILSEEVYAGSSFDAKSYAAVAGGDNSYYKILNAAVHDKYD